MSEIEQRPLLGILGGMGPMATVDFLGKLTRLTPALCDQQHLPWLTLSQPGTPDRSTAIQSGSDIPLAYLVQGAAWLAAQGVTSIAVPCVSSHFWYGQMQAASAVPVLHIADAAMEELQAGTVPGSAVAVLATRGTVRCGIFSSRLAERGYTYFALGESDQADVDAIIADVKRGQAEPAQRCLHQLLMRLEDAGVQAVILGCTELPIALGATCAMPRTIDVSYALARMSLRRLGYAL